MLNILKKEKPEKASLNLQNTENQKVAIKASLDHKVPLIYKGDGIFLIDLKHAKEERLKGFLEQFISESVDRIQGAIFRDDPKCDYVVIYDKK